MVREGVLLLLLLLEEGERLLCKLSPLSSLGRDTEYWAALYSTTPYWATVLNCSVLYSPPPENFRSDCSISHSNWSILHNLPALHCTTAYQCYRVVQSSPSSCRMSRPSPTSTSPGSSILQVQDILVVENVVLC